MSVREVNQRWLATIGLDDGSLALLDDILERVGRLRVTYGPRPPWWRLLARRRWDRWMAGVEQRVLDRMRAEIEAS